MEYSYNKLRGKIVEVFGSQTEFAEALGVSRTIMSQKINGKTGFSQSDIEKWANLLGIKQEDYGAYFFN